MRPRRFYICLNYHTTPRRRIGSYCPFFLGFYLPFFKNVSNWLPPRHTPSGSSPCRDLTPPFHSYRLRPVSNVTADLWLFCSKPFRLPIRTWSIQQKYRKFASKHNLDFAAARCLKKQKWILPLFLNQAKTAPEKIRMDMYTFQNASFLVPGQRNERFAAHDYQFAPFSGNHCRFFVEALD